MSFPLPSAGERPRESALPLTVGFRRCEICALLLGADINSSFGLETVKGVVGEQVIEGDHVVQEIRIAVIFCLKV